MAQKAWSGRASGARASLPAPLPGSWSGSSGDRPGIPRSCGGCYSIFKKPVFEVATTRRGATTRRDPLLSGGAPGLRGRGLVNLQIPRGGTAPREIGLHSAPHQLLPALSIAESAHGAPDRLHQLEGEVLPEDEAVRSRRILVHVHDRIREPSGRPDQGHAAVPQTVHLVEPARFVARRHHEHVASRLDEVRESLVETEDRKSTRLNSSHRTIS